MTRTTCACALALALNLSLSPPVVAQAASDSPLPPAAATDPAFAAAEQAKPASGRGLFALTIAGLVAQGIGNGIGAGLSQGLGGSILKWFQREENKKPAEVVLPPAFESATPASTPAATPRAGLAYEIHRVERDGGTRAVDPAAHVFRTGDQFVVFFRPALPGRVVVSNVNGQGVARTIERTQIAAATLTTLGPYQFVGAKGDETLDIVTEPCTTPALTVATRNLVKVKAPAPASAAFELADCAVSRGARMVRARDIRKPVVEGGTAFALDPLRAEEVASGVVEPRKVTIALKHR